MVSLRQLSANWGHATSANMLLKTFSAFWLNYTDQGMLGRKRKAQEAQALVRVSADFWALFNVQATYLAVSLSAEKENLTCGS